MGLLPLIIKDIAWPQRRVAYVSHELHWSCETARQALGLRPVVVKEMGIGEIKVIEEEGLFQSAGVGWGCWLRIQRRY